MGRLDGKVAIVTGAASGIGKGIALRFGREGAKVVVVTDRRVALGEETAATIREAGGDALFVQGDVSSSADTRRFVAATVERYSGLDVLVQNATWSARGRAVDLAEEDWDRTLDVGLKSIYLGAKYAIPEMRKRGGGAIVNISSVNGLAASPQLAAYNAVKGGINNLTRNLAIDYGRHNIRVNAIAPGHVVTESSGAAIHRDPHQTWSFTDACPMGRVGTPDDIAGAALFLASDDASWLTGEILVVDGGMSIQVPEVLVAAHYRRLGGKPAVAPIEDPPAVD
ncbi:MAG: glucose 1-dehydrogenase [Chloroflexi bacterium]|nr:glucose 1-dehydrogenase [Chloroflexota bacterium]